MKPTEAVALLLGAFFFQFPSKPVFVPFLPKLKTYKLAYLEILSM